MEKLIHWVDTFNTIARSPNNYHSFYIEKSGDSVGATLLLEEVIRVENCRGGSYAAATVTMEKEKATLEISSGTYKKCPTDRGYAAEYQSETVEKINLGDDPELLDFIKSMKNEGDFITLLEAVLQAATSQ